MLNNICEFPPQYKQQINKPKIRKSKERKLNKKYRGAQSLPKLESNRGNSAAGNNEGESASSIIPNSEVERHSSHSKRKKLSPIQRRFKKTEKLIPISVGNTDIHIDPNRKVLYRKIHKYGKKEYLIEISKTKLKYYIISIRLNKSQKQQVLEYHYKQGKKLIKCAGGVEALADRIKFKFGSLSIHDLNKLLYQTQDGTDK